MTMIAKNQTAGALAISQLPIPDQEIPASGQVTLTDYASISEIQNDDELKAHIAAGDVILSDGTQDFSGPQSLAMVTTSTERTPKTSTNLSTYGIGASDGALAGTTDTVYATVFQCPHDVTIHEIEWYCVTGSSSDVHVGIYNGARDTLLAYGVSVNPTGNTFERVTLNQSLDLVAGEKYYPAIMQEDGGVAWAYSTVSSSTMSTAVYTTWNQQNLPPSIAGAGGSSYATWFGFYGDVSTIVTERSAYADYFNSTSYQGITTSPSTIPLDTERQSSTAFTLAANEVTINRRGVYRIDLDLSLDESSTNDTTVDMWLEKNTVEVAGTRARMFHDANMEEGGNHSMCLLPLAVGDVLRMRAEIVQGSAQTDTLADGARMLIQTVGSDGAPGEIGPQGPAGSGSTINIDDEGASIGSPFSTLDFVGAGVTATDAGSGTATITIPGGGGGGGSANIAQYRKAINQALIFNQAWQVSLDATDFEDANYTRSGGDITINTDGVYRVSYVLYFDTGANARRSVDGWCENNGTEIVPSRSSAYARNNVDDTASPAASFFVELLQNDVITLHAQSTGTMGTATLQADRVWITLEFLRAP